MDTWMGLNTFLDDKVWCYLFHCSEKGPTITGNLSCKLKVKARSASLLRDQTQKLSNFCPKVDEYL